MGVQSIKLDLSDGNPFRKESRNHTGAFAAKLGYVKVGFASNIRKLAVLIKNFEVS